MAASCQICQQPFVASNPKQSICGSEDCKKERMRRYQVEAYQRKKGRTGAKSSPAVKVAPPAAAPLLPASALPWVTPDLCAAVRQAMAIPSARRAGRFAIVRERARPKSILVQVSLGRLAAFNQTVLLVATLNDRGRWAQRPPAPKETP